MTFNETNLRMSVDRLIKKVNGTKSSKKDWQRFLGLPHNVPTMRENKISSEDSERDHCSAVQDTKQKLKRRNGELCRKLSKQNRKCRNTYKQLKRRDAAVEHQTQKISSLSDALSDEKKRGDIDETP